MITVTETQHDDKTRTYQLKGPQVETVRSFWDYLVQLNIIESYEIKES